MQIISSPFTLIKKSIDVFFKRENLVFFAKIYLPIGILSIISAVSVYIPVVSNYLSVSQGKPITSILNVLFVLITVFVNLAGIIAISKVQEDKKENIRDIYKVVIKRYWKFLFLSIILYVLYIVGLLVLVVPFVLFSTWFIFSKFLIVVENKGIKLSLKESKKLVKGKFWKILVRNLVFGIFYILSQIIFSSLPYGVGMVIFSFLGALYILPTYYLYKEVSLQTID